MAGDSLAPPLLDIFIDGSIRDGDRAPATDHLGCGKRAVRDEIRAARALEREAGVPDSESVISAAVTTFAEEPQTDPWSDPRWESLWDAVNEAMRAGDLTNARIRFAAILAVMAEGCSDLEEASAQLAERTDEQSVQLRATINETLPDVWPGLAQNRHVMRDMLDGLGRIVAAHRLVVRGAGWRPMQRSGRASRRGRRDTRSRSPARAPTRPRSSDDDGDPEQPLGRLDAQAVAA